MLPNEASWLGRHLDSIASDRLFPLLNVGSSTAQLREHDQPWIDGSIFAPMRRRGGRVIHLDMKPDAGVDLVGDLDDPAFFDSLRGMGVRSVLCSNVLEHVRDPGALARKLVDLVPVGGVITISVPRGFPYHPDPIDTGFRPDVPTVAALFPNTRLLDGAEVECGTVFSLLRGNVTRLALKSAGIVADGLRGRRAPKTAAAVPSDARPQRLSEWLWPWSVRPFVVTCAMLERV